MAPPRDPRRRPPPKSQPPTCQPPLFPRRLRRRPRRSVSVRHAHGSSSTVTPPSATVLESARARCGTTLIPIPSRPHSTDCPHSPVAYDDDHSGLSVSGMRAAAHPPRRPPLRRRLLVRVTGRVLLTCRLRLPRSEPRPEPPAACICIVARRCRHQRSRSHAHPQPSGAQGSSHRNGVAAHARALTPLSPAFSASQRTRDAFLSGLLTPGQSRSRAIRTRLIHF